jgi:hypothetical protein
LLGDFAAGKIALKDGVDLGEGVEPLGETAGFFAVGEAAVELGADFAGRRAILPVRAMGYAECGVRSAECGVRSAECGGWRVECGGWRVEGGGRSAEGGGRRAEGGGRRAEGGIRGSGF